MAKPESRLSHGLLSRTGFGQNLKSFESWPPRLLERVGSVGSGRRRPEAGAALYRAKPMETELSAPSTRREARADASAGHVRQLSAGISAASMSELLPKTSHTRSQSQTSNDSCATFVVNNVPEYAPENDGVEGPASFTDSDSVRFTAAADGIIDDWEGLEQGLVNSLYPMRYMRKRAVQEWNLLSRQWRMYVTVRVCVVHHSELCACGFAFHLQGCI